MTSISLERSVIAQDWATAMTEAITLFTTYLYTPTTRLEKVCLEMDTTYGWRTGPKGLVTKFYVEFTMREGSV